MGKLSFFFGVFYNVTLEWFNTISMLFTTVLFLPTIVSTYFLSYYFDYSSFLAALGIFIGLDTLTGTWLALKKGKGNLKKFSAVFAKMVVYAVYIMILHQISSLEWFSEFDQVTAVITKLMLLTMTLNEGRSVVYNSDEVYPNPISDFMVQIFDFFEKTINLKKKQILGDDTENNNVDS